MVRISFLAKPRLHIALRSTLTQHLFLMGEVRKIPSTCYWKGLRIFTSNFEVRDYAPMAIGLPSHRKRDTSPRHFKILNLSMRKILRIEFFGYIFVVHKNVK